MQFCRYDTGSSVGNPQRRIGDLNPGGSLDPTALAVLLLFIPNPLRLNLRLNKFFLSSQLHDVAFRKRRVAAALRRPGIQAQDNSLARYLFSTVNTLYTYNPVYINKLIFIYKLVNSLLILACPSAGPPADPSAPTRVHHITVFNSYFHIRSRLLLVESTYPPLMSASSCRRSSLLESATSLGPDVTSGSSAFPMSASVPSGDRQVSAMRPLLRRPGAVLLNGEVTLAPSRLQTRRRPPSPAPPDSPASAKCRSASGDHPLCETSGRRRTCSRTRNCGRPNARTGCARRHRGRARAIHRSFTEHRPLRAPIQIILTALPRWSTGRQPIEEACPVSDQPNWHLNHSTDTKDGERIPTGLTTFRPQLSSHNVFLLQ